MRIVFGPKDFKNKFIVALSKKDIESHKNDYNRTRDLPSIESIVSACAKFFKIKEHDLYHGRRGVSNEPRKIALYTCRVWGAKKLHEIAEKFFTNSHSNVSNAVREITKRQLSEKKLEKIINEIKMLLDD